MMNKSLFSGSSKLAILLGGFSFLLPCAPVYPSTGKLLLSCEDRPAYSFLNDPPVFESDPGDVTVDCVSDIPIPQAITATDDTDPSFPKAISPVDAPDPSTIDPCEGGLIRRTWTAVDAEGNTSVVEQLINILPDLEGPVVDLPEVHEEVTCGQDDFEAWLNSLTLQLSVSKDQVFDACGRIGSITFQPQYEDPSLGPCETRPVTFFITDQCGNTTTWQASYATRDDSDPVFSDLPADITLGCKDEVPPPPILTATDNCTAELSVNFEETIVPDATCPGIGRTIIRRWTATDDCGNQAETRQVISLADQQGPVFTPPPATTISCSEDVKDLGITGNVVGLNDDCDPFPTVSFTDVITNEICPNTYTITRTWQAVDACGNPTTKTQLINVIDEEAPAFVVPPDVTVSCDQVNNPDITGRPTMVTDNCDDNPRIFIQEETILPGALDCPNSYLIERVWAVEDACGQATEKTQRLTVVDEVPPVFVQLPMDRRISCSSGINPEQAFAQWLASYGESEASDNCSLAEDLVWTARNAGTDAPPSLPPFDCSLEGNIVRQQKIDFFVEDECGNRIRAAATFSVIDDSAPVIRNCPEEETVFTDPGTCEGTFSFRIPQVEEDCVFGQDKYDGLTFEYRVGHGNRRVMDPAETTTVTLPQGINLLTYYVTDCSGNADSCAFFVRVRDGEPPVLNCPDDIVANVEPGSCTASVTLPLPLGISDNCTAGGLYERRLPSTAAAGLLTFGYDPDLDDYLAQDRTFIFPATSDNATGPATLTLTLRGDFDSGDAFVRLLGEDGQVIGQSAVGDASCDREGQITFSIPRNTINNWAADGQVEISMEFNDIPVPPGEQGDGVNPCNPQLVEENGDDDGISYAFATLRYRNSLPAYFATGATNLPLTQMLAPAEQPAHSFAIGETTVSYIVSDNGGNADTCTFRVIVKDETAPTVRCQPVTVFINPAGTGRERIDPALIDAGSTDNCRIDTMFLTPNTFACGQAGSTVDVTLTVVDESGNRASCSTPIRIENLKPEPTATSGVCGNDTLYLFANPPEADGRTPFTYRWTGPDGFFSDKENPVIPNVDPEKAGSYVVEITGITGCKAIGTVEVSIEGLPLTPELIIDENLCVNEEISLHSSVVPVGTRVTYRWYEGLPPSGQLIGSTDLPVFSVPGPVEVGLRNFYLTVEADGCTSAPSAPKAVRISEIPRAEVNDPEITVCEGEAIALGTSVSGSDLRYEWTGPNGFVSGNPFPAVIQAAELADAGVYRLVIIKNGCASDEALSVVNVLPRPQQPQLSDAGGPVCEGGEIVLATNVAQASFYRWISPDLQEFISADNRLTVADANQNQAGPWKVSVSQAGCESQLSAPLEVEVNPNPQVFVTASGKTVCENDKLQLFATPTLPDAIYRWTGPDEFSAAIQNPIINNITKANEGIYQVSVSTSQGCSGTASATVLVQKSVVVTAVSNDAPECLSAPTDVRLAASVFPSDPGTYKYRWTGPGGFLSSESTALVRNATAANNGNYQLVVTTAGGCSSLPATTIVGVANPPAVPSVPRISPNTPAPYCEGKNIQLLSDSYSGARVRYYWRTPKGIITTSAPTLDILAAGVDDSGDYSVFVAINDCNSQESGKLNLKVGRGPSIAVSSNSPVCEGESLKLNSELIAGAEYFWTGPGFASNLPNPVIENARPSQHDGTYALRVSLDGCLSSLVVEEVAVKPAPARPVALNDGPVCLSDDDAALSLSVGNQGAAPEITYTWFDPFGVLISNTSQSSIQLTEIAKYGNGPTEFTVLAQRDGCSSPTSAPTIALLYSTPSSQAFAGDDFTGCDGFSIELEAASPTLGTGRWTLLSGKPEGVMLANPDQPSTAVTGLEGGLTYTFRWTLSNGACRDYSFDDVAVFVTESEEVNAGEDILTCEPGTLNLDALPVRTNQAFWSQADLQALLGVEIADPSDPKTAVSGLEPGNLYFFTWTVVGGCGEISDDVLVLISDPAPFAGPDQEVCNDEGFVQLQADELTGGSRGRWSSLTPGVNFSDVRDPLTFATNLAEGDNFLIWTIDQGICGSGSKDTVVISYKVNPVAIPDEVAVAFGQQVVFDPAANDLLTPGSFVNIVKPPEKGRVVTGDLGEFIYISNADFAGTEQLTYELCSKACECSLSTVTFKVGEDVECRVPNIFTPNNDGVNDSFVVPCLLNDDNYPLSQVLIFNRWGDEVFKSPTPYKNDWEGTFNGEALPAGTYFYIIDLGDGSPPINGFTLIQR